MQKPLLVQEVFQGEDHRKCLADDGGCRGAPDPHAESIDHYRVEYGVGNHCKQGKPHRELRVSGRPDHAVQSEIQVGDHVADGDYGHVVPGKRQCVLAGSEKCKDWIDERESENGEKQADGDIQADYVSEDLVGDVIVFLAEQHRDHGRSSDAHEGA